MYRFYLESDGRCHFKAGQGSQDRTGVTILSTMANYDYLENALRHYLDEKGIWHFLENNGREVIDDSEGLLSLDLSQPESINFLKTMTVKW